jgi:hypothetical protein
MGDTVRQLVRIAVNGSTAELAFLAGLIIAVVCLIVPGISTAGGIAGAAVGAFLAVGGAVADAWTRTAETAGAAQVTAARVETQGAAQAAQAASTAGNLMAALGAMGGPEDGTR